eukprot:TRINITY_DN18853_c0_g1_i1.p1 TRINITY_DN18853_c0_g1~~TRINITY_DN18853_c0_g1_i1.p1  ORF type:complete len:248 (+),score=62.81 TRINITY_DN18853_c0_g1_i1:3-746(+)
MATPQFTLYYWPIVARGEFIRSMFKALNVPFRDIAFEAIEDKEDAFSRPTQDKWGSIPTDKMMELRAAGICHQLPILIHHKPEGDVQMYQAPVIIRYLADTLCEGILAPEKNDVLEAEMIMGSIYDLVNQTRIYSFDPLKAVIEPQKEWQAEGRKFFVSNVLPKYMSFVESWMARINSGFCVGKKATYVDVVLRVYMQNLKDTVPEFTFENMPTIMKHHQVMETSLPALTNYVASRPFKFSTQMPYY